MKSKILKVVSLIVALTCILCYPVNVSATAQGTNGTELEVVQPQKLEIQLGKAWSGVEFQLKTDIGNYPAAIPVGEDGVLRLEIGGSSRYILTCLNSSAAVPSPEVDATVQTTQTAEPTEETTTQTSEATDPTVTEPVGEEAAQALTVAGIPVSQIIIFGVGLLLALGALIFMQMHKISESEDADEDEA